jgi:hypothetical protein
MWTIETIIEDFLAEAREDWIGLWAIVGAVRDRLDLTSNAEVKARTLDVIRGLIDQGLWPGNFGTDKKFHEWTEPDAAACLARIDSEWDVTKGDPVALDAICWFYWKTK